MTGTWSHFRALKLLYVQINLDGEKTESEMARAGAGAGDSSAIREASRGVEASADADACPL